MPTSEESDRRSSLQDYLRNPPDGSKARQAMDFGIDLSLTFRNMFERTMADRLRLLDEHVAEAHRRPAKARLLGRIPE
jgi:hypothetical protein